VTDDTPLERAQEAAKLRAYAARMTRNPDAKRTPVHNPTLEEEHAALVKAGIIPEDPTPVAPARASTLQADIAARVAHDVFQILNTPDGTE